MTGHHLFGWLLSSHCLIQAISPDPSIATCPYPSQKSSIKGLDFLCAIAGLSTRVLFTSRPAYNLPNSWHKQPFKLAVSKGGKRTCETPWENAYCLRELEATVLRVSILPPHHTPCFLSIILEHQVLGQQFCPQDVCLQALPPKFQSSWLPLIIQTQK